METPNKKLSDFEARVVLGLQVKKLNRELESIKSGSRVGELEAEIKRLNAEVEDWKYMYDQQYFEGRGIALDCPSDMLKPIKGERDKYKNKLKDSVKRMKKLNKRLDKCTQEKRELQNKLDKVNKTNSLI
jgi:DNA repair exonuclease SbcCD ATPase subunit